MVTSAKWHHSDKISLLMFSHELLLIRMDSDKTGTFSYAFDKTAGKKTESIVLNDAVSACRFLVGRFFLFKLRLPLLSLCESRVTYKRETCYIVDDQQFCRHIRRATFPPMFYPLSVLPSTPGMFSCSLALSFLFLSECCSGAEKLPVIPGRFFMCL